VAQNEAKITTVEHKRFFTPSISLSSDRIYQIYKLISCFLGCKIYSQNEKDQQNSMIFDEFEPFIEHLTAMETWRILVDDDQKQEINLYT